MKVRLGGADRSLPIGLEWRRLALGLAAGLALAGAGCGSAPAASAAAAPPPPGVVVAPVEQRNVALTTQWIASMDGYVNARVQPHVSGYLIRQDYREGAAVRKGQVLFEIDPRPFQATLDQTTAQLAQARAQVMQAQAQLAKTAQDVARDTPLAQARAVAQSQLDDDEQAKAGAAAGVAAAQAAVAAAQAAREQAALNLSFTQVTSLVSGIAGRAEGQIGDLVGTATVLTSVSQVDPIKVYFPLSEQDYLRAQDIGTRSAGEAATPLRGVPLTLLLADGSVYPHTGKVIWADRQVDASTGTIQVAAAFPNPGNILRPGGYARVQAVTQTRTNALLVPQAAVTELQGSYQVAIVGADNKVKVTTVQLGPQVGGDWIINQGVAPGERVVVAGLQAARDGATVRPRLAPPAPPVGAGATGGGR